MMRTVAIAVMLVIAFLGAACTTVPRASSSQVAAPQSISQITETIRLAYNRGFELLAQQIPNQSADSPYARLQQLKNFRQEWVRWAELKGSSYQALESGHSRGAWMVVVPPGHEVLKRMVATLEVRIESNPPLNVLLVKPESVSELWSGIVLSHELSHLMDRVYQTEPNNPTRQQFLEGELRAYEIEQLAASLLSQGALEKQMDRLLARWRPSSHEELADLFSDMPAADWDSLEAALASPTAESEAEMKLRGGFYMIALSLRFLAAQERGRESMLAMLGGLYPEGSPAQ